MNKEYGNYEKTNMYLSLWMWIVLCVSLMVVMLVFASDKTIVIVDASQEQMGLTGDSSRTGHGEQDTALILQRNYGMDGSFCIPLPQDIKPENVIMENRYMSRELRIYIQGGDQNFYKGSSVYGDISHVVEGCSEVWEDGILLKFEMDEVLEYRSTLEGNTLTIVGSKPHELYDFLVVLDPAGGGSDSGTVDGGLTEKELTLEVARLVQRQFELQNVRLYLTRTEDVDVEDQDRVAFVEAVGADLYIRIGVQTDAENPESYGIQGIYNEDYFIPGYGNAALADAVTKAVTIASSNRAVGLVPAAEDSVLRNVGTTAMELSLGYLSNSREAGLLGQSFYREKLASGILDAVEEACEAMEQLREEDK